MPPFHEALIRRDLDAHRELWTGVWFGQHSLFWMNMEMNLFREFSVYLLPRPGMERLLMQLAARWAPASIAWVALDRSVESAMDMLMVKWDERGSSRHQP